MSRRTGPTLVSRLVSSHLSFFSQQKRKKFRKRKWKRKERREQKQKQKCERVESSRVEEEVSTAHTQPEPELKTGRQHTQQQVESSRVESNRDRLRASDKCSTDESGEAND